MVRASRLEWEKTNKELLENTYDDDDVRVGSEEEGSFVRMISLRAHYDALGACPHYHVDPALRTLTRQRC